MPQRLIRDVIAGRRFATLPAEASVMEAAGLMQARRVGSVAVTEGEALAGIFTERDALYRVLAAGLAPQATRLTEVMTSEVQTIGPDKPLGHALHMMYDNGFRHVPVVQGGRPIGMVSARDALTEELREFRADLTRRDEIADVLGP